MGRALLLLLLPFLASAALLAGDPVGPGRVEAAFPGANGKIAFVRRGVSSTARSAPDYQRVHLWTVKANGTAAKRLTKRADVTGSYAPRHAWSPDGTKLVGGSARLRSANGTLLTRHPLWRVNRSAFCPSWTPDGGLVFGGAQGIYVVDAKGRGRRRLPFSTGADECPRISPDGKSITFVRYQADEDGFSYGDFYVAGIDGANVRRLVPGTTSDGLQPESSAEWAPDGKEIGVLWFKGGINIVNVGSGGRRAIDIGLVPAPGSRARAAASTRDLSIAWSPDGKKIAFSRQCRIAVVGAGGGGIKYVTNPGPRACDTLPAWQPIRG